MSGQKKKLAVLMGGWTSEAEISRLSGAYCARAARELGWEVHELEFTRDVAADLWRWARSWCSTLCMAKSARMAQPRGC